MVDVNKKGSRNERKAKDILNQFENVKAEKITQRSNTDHDFFGIADVLGVDRETGELYMIQVKTNGNFTPQKMSHYVQMAAIRLNTELHHFEVWDRTDRQGWEFYRYNPDMKEKAAGHFHHEDWGGMEKYAEVMELNDPQLIGEKLLERREERLSQAANTMEEEHNRRKQIENSEEDSLSLDEGITSLYHMKKERNNKARNGNRKEADEIDETIQELQNRLIEEYGTNCLTGTRLEEITPYADIVQERERE